MDKFFSHGVLGVTGLIFSIAYYICLVISRWRIFKKAGEKGWKSLIPFYDIYTEFKLTWTPSRFWLLILFSVLGSFFMTIGSDKIFFCLLSIAYNIVTIVLTIKGTHRLSKAFGHKAGYTWGLLLLSPIFIIILVFGESKYVGNTYNMEKKD